MEQLKCSLLEPTEGVNDTDNTYAEQENTECNNDEDIQSSKSSEPSVDEEEYIDDERDIWTMRENIERMNYLDSIDADMDMPDENDDNDVQSTSIINEQTHMINNEEKECKTKLNGFTRNRGTSIDSPEDTSIAGDSACIPWRSPIDIATSMVQCLRSPISSRKRHRDDVVGNEMVLQQNYYLDDTSSTCDADAASKVMATTRSFQPLKFVTQCLTRPQPPTTLDKCDSLCDTTLTTRNGYGNKLTTVSFAEHLQDVLSPDTISSSSDSASCRLKIPFYRHSKFSNVPPTIQFAVSPDRVSKPDRKTRKLLCWCHNSLLPKVMRKTLANSHFSVVDENLYWLGFWGRHMTSKRYRTVFPHQKINHFAGTFHLGRKDRLWQNLQRAANIHGRHALNIMPNTFILPAELAKLKQYMKGSDEVESPSCNTNTVRIILKPPALARGSGIKIVCQWRKVPRDQEVVAQIYIERPFLINDTKFDLRLYVAVTSFNPLRIYLYEDGLVRFASQKYSNAPATLSNQFMHLTNYSINKHNEQQPCDKWSLRTLWSYLSERGHNVATVMEQIVDVVLKAVICCETSIVSHLNAHVRHSFVCYELLGFDILLDEQLKPWLLEVNISPSLQSATEVDRQVKYPLARDALNLAGIQVPPNDNVCKWDAAAMNSGDTRTAVPSCPQAPISSLVADYRCKPIDQYLTSAEREKRTRFEALFAETPVCSLTNNKYKLKNVDAEIISNITPSDVRILIETEDEYDRRGSFTRLFPSPFGSAYLKYFMRIRYSDLLLNAWTTKYFNERQQGCDLLEQLCQKNFHIYQASKEK